MTLLRQIGRWLGTLLVFAGVVLLVGTGALYGYGQYEEWQQSREAQAIVPVLTPAPAPSMATAVPVVVPTPPQNAQAVTPDQSLGLSRAEQLAEERQVRLVAQPSPTPVPTAIPIYPVERIVASSIHLDSKVVESPIVNGEWTVPKFVAGHLEGTAEPLQGGNVVLSGHVESISSGNVFARLGDLKPGDVVQLYTKDTVVTYVVEKLEVVPNTDVDVIKPGHEETITLITCTGTWLPLQRDYDSRLVVIGGRVG